MMSSSVKAITSTLSSERAVSSERAASFTPARSFQHAMSFRHAVKRGFLVISTLAVFCFAWLTSQPAQAENLIKRPGAHNRYSFEVEPQFAISWAGHSHNYSGDYYNSGFGPGVRFSIPFMHNGPISTINNNIGINFGLNTFFYDNHNNNNEHPITWTVPVAFQWNFYFTDIISVLGEVGLTTNLVTARTYTQFYVDPLFQGGGRFQFGKVGIIVRIGYPMMTVGANFQF